MKHAINFAIASVLLMSAAFAPFAAWGADGIDVIKAGREDMNAFDDMVAKSRPKDAQNARAAARSAFGAKVSAEARKARDERERDIQDSKNFGQWVKSSNNNAGAKGSAAAVVGEGGGGDSSAQSALDATDDGKGKGKGNGNGSGSGKGNGNGH